MNISIAQFTVLHNERSHREWVVVSYKRVKEKCVKGWEWCVAGCRRCSGAAAPAKHRRHHIKPPGALDKLDITQVCLSLCNYICPKPVALIFTAARLFRKHRLSSNGSLQLLVTALQCVPKLSGPRLRICSLVWDKHISQYKKSSPKIHIYHWS